MKKLQHNKIVDGEARASFIVVVLFLIVDSEQVNTHKSYEYLPVQSQY